MTIRPLLLASAFALAGCSTTQTAQSAATVPAPPAFAETESASARTAASLARIRLLNPRLRAVIAADPTAMEQARRLDAHGTARGAVVGEPVLTKGDVGN